MTESNDQMAGKQAHIGSQPSSISGVSNFENLTLPIRGGIPRVRFFTDTEGSGSSAPEGVLTINTSSSGAPPKEEVGSLGRLGDTADTRIPALHHSSTSPTSHRKRNRGYSLRRQVLFRNVHDQTGEDAGVAHSSANDMGVELTSTLETSSKGQSTQLLHKGANHDHTARKSALPSVAGSFPHYTVWAKKRSYTFKGQIISYCRNVRKFLLQSSEILPTKEGRKIPVDAETKTPLIDENSGNEYTNNTIRSSRYTIWNFFPRQLFAQFSKLANL